MRAAIAIMVFALGGITACSKDGPLESMQPGERGRVVRVIDGDALVLDTGQSVRLVGIEAPVLRPRYGDPDPYAETSARLLEDLVMGREVKLFYPGLTRDRYDRALAHLETIDGAGPKIWVNIELVRQGGVRVRLYPDTDARGDLLLAAETDARKDGAGLWSLNAYQPIHAENIEADQRGFSLIDGVLGTDADAPAEPGRRQILCSRRMEGADLIIDMTFSARAACSTPAGSHVLLRGWVNKGRMELVHPLHLELISEP